MPQRFANRASRIAAVLVAASSIWTAAGVSGAFAHVELERTTAAVGSSYQAVFQVSHGCHGSPTTAIRVRVPEGVLNVKPVSKPGWTLNVVTGKYSKTRDLSGVQVAEGVTEIDWTNGKLPDKRHEQFVFQAFLASDLQPGQMLYFPVVQECEKGVQRWIEIPAAGKDYPEPAPGLKLLPKP